MKNNHHPNDPQETDSTSSTPGAENPATDNVLQDEHSNPNPQPETAGSGAKPPFADDPDIVLTAAAGSGDPGGPPDPDDPEPPAEINYEDLGIQLGINEDVEAKDNYKKQLREKITEIEQKYNALCLELKESMSQYRTDLGALINEDMLEHIAKIDEQKNNSLKRLLSHEMALRQILKYVNDEKRKNQVLDSALFEIDSIVGEARTVLQAFKLKLHQTMTPRLVDERFKNHLARQEKLFRQMMLVYKQEENLERGYNYGRSVKLLLGSKL